MCTIYTGALREKRMKCLPLILRGFYVVVFLLGFLIHYTLPFPSLVTITAAPYLQLWAWTYSSLKPKQVLLFWFRTRDIGRGEKLKLPFLLNFSVTSVMEYMTQQPRQYDKLQEKLQQLRLQKIIRSFSSNLILCHLQREKLFKPYFTWNIW